MEVDISMILVNFLNFFSFQAFSINDSVFLVGCVKLKVLIRRKCLVLYLYL